MKFLKRQDGLSLSMRAPHSGAIKNE